MSRTKGSRNRRTLEAFDIIAGLGAPTQLGKVAKAIGKSESAAYAFLHHHRLLHVIGRKGRKGGAYHPLVAQAAAEKTLEVPADMDEDALRRGLIAGIEPGRLAWLLSCPRDGTVGSRKAIGWRGGNAIG